jgi:hypothetical protein
MLARAWIVGSIVLLCPSLALAASYVVAPNGKDSNAGDAANPWATLQHAADTVKAGDTVTVEPGDYAGFNVTTSGTKDSPITFSAKDGVHITSPNGQTKKDGINIEDTENGTTIAYVIVEGFTVNNMPRAGIRSAVSDHVTIRKNKMDQNGVWGILTGFAEAVLIEDNECSRSAEQHGIYVGNSADYPIIRRNKVWGNNANGIHMNGDLSQGGDGIISHAVVEQNLIYDNGKAGGSGINCDGVQDSVIQNNLVYAEHASGISLYMIDAAEPAKNNKVINNTILIASDGRWALNIREGASGNHVYNNILWNDHPFRGSITIAMDALPGFVSDYNLMLDRFTLDDGNTVIKLSDWMAQTNQDSASSTAAPKFVNAAGDDYHSAADSPAVDKGTETEAPGIDLDGVTRPQGASFDIGAYELCAAGNCQSGTGGAAGAGGSSTGGGGAGGMTSDGGGGVGGSGGSAGAGGAATGGAGGAATGGAGGSSATGGSGTGGNGTGAKGSCGCRATGIDPQDGGALLLVAAGLSMAVARRRPSRRALRRLS